MKGTTTEYRAFSRAPEMRDDGAEMPTMVGTLAVFNEWTEIHSRSEGHFLERIAPSAFTRTVKNNIDQMRVLFQHGKDPQIGEKPLGPISNINVTGSEVRYEVPLFDTSYNRDLIPLLNADPPVLGSSFRFETVDQDWKRRPGRSAHNPRGLDERTVTEVRMPEFGPVTFPAYRGTKAGLRSLTDEMRGIVDELDEDERTYLIQMLDLGARYMADESDENVQRMEVIVASLSELVPTEADARSDETTDEANAESKDDGTHEGEPVVDAARDAEPVAEDLRPIVLTPRGPDPLYTGRQKEAWRL